MDRLVRLAIANHTPEELAKGFIRYESMRTLRPATFRLIAELKLSGRQIDNLLDAAAAVANEQEPTK